MSKHDDMGPMPAVHERFDSVERAGNDLMGILIEWRVRHGLTSSEECYLLSEALMRLGRSCIRRERERRNDR